MSEVDTPEDISAPSSATMNTSSDSEVTADSNSSSVIDIEMKTVPSELPLADSVSNNENIEGNQSLEKSNEMEAVPFTEIKTVPSELPFADSVNKGENIDLGKQNLEKSNEVEDVPFTEITIKDEISSPEIQQKVDDLLAHRVDRDKPKSDDEDYSSDDSDDSSSSSSDSEPVREKNIDEGKQNLEKSNEVEDVPFTEIKTVPSELPFADSVNKDENIDEGKQILEKSNEVEDVSFIEIKTVSSELSLADSVNRDENTDLEKQNLVEDVPFTEIKVKDKIPSPEIQQKVVDLLAYRVDRDKPKSDDEDYSSDDSDDSSSSSDSELVEEKSKNVPSDRDDGKDEKTVEKKKSVFSTRTRGELYPEDLPPLEELKISVDEAVEMQEIGEVASIVGVLVVIQANKDIPALNEETVLFTENREPFGKIFEVFGAVVSPFYSVRFNSAEDIVNKNISAGLPIYCAPTEEEYTQFVFIEQLERIKGSDASWENNNEPPSMCVDFSDDEDEKKVKAKNRRRPTVKEGDPDDQAGSRKGRHRNKNPRFENKMGTDQEHNREQFTRAGQRGGRGRRQWPPKQDGSWPPKDCSGWPPRAQEPWPHGQGDGDWQPQNRQFDPRDQTSHPYINPGSFPGGRGGRHPGAAPRFQGPFQDQHRGGPLGGPQGPPPCQRMPNQNFRGGPFQGQPNAFSPEHTYETGPNCRVANSNILMDTRLVQNPNHNVDAPPFGMMRPPRPRLVFGGQPQFSPGPMGGPRPGMPGMGNCNSGPPGRW